jgi:cell division protein FtsQ
MAKHHYSFPVLTGIDAGDSADSRKARMDVYLRMMAELDADGKHNSEQISEIDLTDPEDARVLMPEQGADVLAHFGEDHFLERCQRYQAHIAEWRQQYPHLTAVDLRYDNQVVLEMASGKETAETANGDTVAPSATPSPDAKPMTDAKSSGAKPAGTKISSTKPLAAKTSGAKTAGTKISSTKPLGAKKSGAKTSDASTANKSKPAQDKKHVAPAKQAAAESTTKQNSASTTRPATASPGTNSRSPRVSAAIVAQGG